MREKLIKQENKLAGMPELSEAEVERIKTEFHKFYPAGELEMINKEDVPAEVMEHFFSKSQSFVDSLTWKPDKLKNFGAVSHGSGDKTYFSQEVKAISMGEGSLTDEWTYFVSMRGGEKLIHGDVTRNFGFPPAEEEKQKKERDKLFLQSLFTERDKRDVTAHKNKRQGFGERMLDVINAYAKSFYRLPLYIDTNMSEDAKGFFARLHEKGKAKRAKLSYETWKGGKREKMEYDQYYME